MKGWISLHRKILDNPVVNFGIKYSRFEAWVWLLLRANFEERKVVIGSSIYKCKKGEIITSQKKLCKQFKWGNSRLRNFLKLLKIDKMIELKSNTKLTMITILNYDSYQNNKLQTNTKQKTNKQPININNNDNKEIIEIRKEKFENDVISSALQILPNPHPDIIKEFVNYWTELNTSGKKMKKELERTWETKKRLRTWIKRQETWGRNVLVGSSEKFKLDTTGNARIGYCEKCGNSDFYDKFKIVNEDSTCCNAGLIPERKN